jgi:hypothetical protein
VNDDASEKLSLPSLDQVGFVVREMEGALALYEPLFGPFTQMEAPVEGADFRGESSDCRLKLAFGRSGPVEIELIQWVSGPCPHREFIESGRQGLHHLRFRVGDVDAKVEEARALGYEPFWYKRMSADIAFAYLERPGDSLVLEFLEMD